jgi:C-type mannose receptor
MDKLGPVFLYLLAPAMTMLVGCLFPSFEGMQNGGGSPTSQAPEVVATRAVPVVDSGPARDGGVVAIDASRPESCNGIDDDLDGVIDQKGCTDRVEHFQGHAYMFVKAEKTWASARSHCASFGYHLATIDGVDENNFIRGIAEGIESDEWWIGFNDIATENSFVWEDGSHSTFTNWSSGSPDDFFNQDCAVLISSDATGAWNDKACDDQRPFVCEAGR